MHFSDDVARIILEYCTDTVLSVMERMYKISNELDIYQIKAYIAMEEWDNQDVIITGCPNSFDVEWRKDGILESGEYNLSAKKYVNKHDFFQIDQCTSLKQFNELLIEHGIHTTPMYRYKNPLDNGPDVYKFKEEMIDLLTGIKF